MTPVFDEFKKKRYIAHLKKEIETFFVQKEQSQSLDTIYFGGGTPSVLSLSEVRDILDSFPVLSPDCEVSFECNPEDITTEYVVGLFQLGINRISVGVQSLNDNTLQAIHRSNKQSIIEALSAIELAVDGHDGISVNVDFILGLPHVGEGEILKNIQELHRRYKCITHTSVYMLESGLYPAGWEGQSLSEELMQDDFRSILSYFEERDWHHYELSNFAQVGYESRHNRGYWDHSSSRGFGLAAASYVDSRRWNNSDSFVGYYEGRIEDEEILTAQQILMEDMMFGLRTQGVDISRMSDMVSTTRMDTLIASGLLIRDNNTLRVTKTGIFLIDYIMAELISG